jgi:uncharacterized phage-associated protein
MKKTKQLLAYLIQNNPSISITALMKFTYICDLVAIQKYNKQISNFEYVRYKYGPFDQHIYNHIEQLRKDGVLLEEPAYTPMGDEYITYKINDETGCCIDKLTKEEIQIADEVLESLKGYGAKALVDLAYKTKPMVKIGAKQDNDAGLNEHLDLKAK